ncbi:unnamed protein product [Effrenium voratum]|nr:unnamed protein product [Effrenium voratum]
MSAGKAAGMGKSKKRFTDQRPGGSTRKPTAAYFLAEVPVPVDKGLPGSTSKVEYPSLQAASKQLPTNSQGAAQDALEEPKSTGDAVTQTVAAIAALVDKKVDAMRPQREQLKRCIEACLEACLSGDVLEGSIVEVVGSTAWGGEVPQSDLDLVLVTPSSSSTPSQALVLLQALVAKLESQSKAERHWSRLELVEARKVPVLRLHDRAGLSCDVVVDQLHALDHRKLLAEALEGRPEVKSFIRLVKYWLRQRGLPVGSEGGLPSFAWAYTALQFAMQRPKNASVQDLLFHFFKQMNLLSSMSLLLQQKENGVTVAWKSRKDPAPWSQEWIELLVVDDPTRKHPSGAGYQSMTPPTIPSALGALYLAEVRLALAAMKEAKWDELWRPASSEVKTLLPAALKGKAQLHIVLKDGELTVGRLDKVLRCPNVQNEELHRRDQSSELQLRACSLSKDPKSDSTKLSLTEESLCCKPCNWVCALPTWNMAAKAGDAQTRLNELVAMVQSWKCKSNPPVPAAADGRMYVPVMAPIIVGGQCGLQQGVFMPVYRVASFYPGVQQPAPDQGSRQVSSVVVLNDLFKAWTGAPRAVGLQKAVQAPRIQGKARQPASSQDKKPAERTQEASEAQEVCPSEKGSGAAGSDDSTRASDSEEFFPVRKQKGKKAPRKARDCRPTQSEKAPDQPFATALALNLDAPSRRESWPFLTDKPKIQSRS